MEKLGLDERFSMDLNRLVFKIKSNNFESVWPLGTSRNSYLSGICHPTAVVKEKRSLGERG